MGIRLHMDVSNGYSTAHKLSVIDRNYRGTPLVYTAQLLFCGLNASFYLLSLHFQNICQFRIDVQTPSRYNSLCLDKGKPDRVDFGAGRAGIAARTL